MDKVKSMAVVANTNTTITKPTEIKVAPKEKITDDYENEKSSSVTVFPKIKEETKSTITSAPEKTAVSKKQEVTNNKQDIASAKPENKKVEVPNDQLTSKNLNAKASSKENDKPGVAGISTMPRTENINNNQLPEKKEVITTNIQPVAKTVIKKQPSDANSPAALVDERKSEFAQEVIFKSDSLELSLYDNGEIDGDTVSVLLNGEVILAKQGLKASAIKKTIYVPSGNTDSLVLVLYAENLGKYPPNTGLMIVHDGDDVYQVRFSADLQKNAGVIFRKKKN